MTSTLTRGYEDDPNENDPNNTFDTENLRWAMRLHTALLKVDGLSDRGIRRARFLGVLRTQKRPAVLIEGGYLSNLHEARRIADPAFRQKLAEAVARAFGESSEVGGQKSEGSTTNATTVSPPVDDDPTSGSHQ